MYIRCIVRYSYRHSVSEQSRTEEPRRKKIRFMEYKPITHTSVYTLPTIYTEFIRGATLSITTMTPLCVPQ